jgi:hypothetical protein
MLAEKALYHLDHTPSPFCFSYFLDRVSCFLCRLALDHDPPTYAFCIAGIIECVTMPTLLLFLTAWEMFQRSYSSLSDAGRIDVWICLT